MQIAQDSVMALQFLHSIDMIHSDIKAANFFLRGDRSDEYKIKLGDFGESIQACVTRAQTNASFQSSENEKKDKRVPAGTLPFTAPELFTCCTKPTKQSDIYR